MTKDAVVGQPEDTRVLRFAKDIYHRIASRVAVTILRPGALTPEVVERFHDKRINIQPAGFYASWDPYEVIGVAGQELPTPGVDFQPDQQHQILTEVLPGYVSEFQALPSERQKNDAFISLDALIYYAFIRHFKPNKIVEVGAGYSTLLADAALLRNGGGSLIAIDPYPRQILNDLKIGQVRAKEVQDEPIETFMALRQNDILFTDSSHVLRQGGDTQYLHLNIFPRLAKGTLVHVHDIYSPNNYPPELIREQRYWTEMQMLMAYLSENTRAQVLLGSQYILNKYYEETRQLFSNTEPPEGNSFWFRKV